MNNEDLNIKNATQETFWGVINKYKICIPKMQRNYAQGRNESDVVQKRENLLNDIFNALTMKNKLDLNFIYGNIVDDKFIPIDGQQRLTTLFLVYWYFSILCNRKDNPVFLLALHLVLFL